MNESCPSRKVRYVQELSRLRFSLAKMARLAVTVLVMCGLFGCNKDGKGPQKRTPRPDRGDDPVFAVDFRSSRRISHACKHHDRNHHNWSHHNWSHHNCKHHDCKRFHRRLANWAATTEPAEVLSLD
jgi:hypothetical protein